MVSSIDAGHSHHPGYSSDSGKPQNTGSTKRGEVSEKPVVWLMSSYRTDSHAQWADWLVSTHQQISWHRLELPGRRFRWRIRGNPISWLDKLPEAEPDVILATSMVDLATIKGLHPRLAHVPAWYYFHENQFAYPLSEHQVNRIDPQMVQLYGALTAERLFFNSEFNRRSFLDGVFELLRTKPQAESQEIRLRLERKSTVLPVPITPITPAESKDARLIVWNHRWEYDKAPNIFAEAMIKLSKKDDDFRLALLGDRSTAFPDQSLLLIREKLPEFIIADGRVDRESYLRILSKAGVVVSTALHEFQGLAMLEAVSAGARPLVPDALCYPEQYPDEYRYPPGDVKTLTTQLAHWLRRGLPPTIDVSEWYSSRLKEQWRKLFEEVKNNG